MSTKSTGGWFRGVWWMLWSLMSSVAFWVLARRPSHLPPSGDYLLMTEPEIEELVSNVFDFAQIVATPDLIGEDPASELSFQREFGSHDEGESSVVVEEEGIDYVPTTLTFYVVSEVPGLSAIARFTAYDENGEVLVITEDTYGANTAERTRLDEEVEDALINGIDVVVMSHEDVETFPVIHSVLGEDPKEV
jgi:hypothetical protein